MKRTISIAALLFLAAGTLFAAPRSVNYQGYLTDSGGSPVPDGDYDLKVSIYADSVTASFLWQENPTVTVEGGVFHVILGAVNPLDASLFDGEPRWLGVRIESDPEIAPRTKITSVPWALRAAVADTVLHAPSGGVGDGHSLDASDGDPEDAVYVNGLGAVGIGTTIPDWPLHLRWDIDNPVRFMIENPNTGDNGAEVLTLKGGPNTYFNITSYNDEHSGMAGAVVFESIRPGSNLQFRQNNVEQMRLDSLGNLGIGRWNPQYRLDVAGDARVDGFHMATGAAPGYVLTTDILGNGTWQAPAAVSDGDWTVSGDHMYSTAPGNVGVGTSTPVSDLHVVGSDTLGTFMVAPGLTVNEDSRLFLAEDNDGTFGMEWRYDGVSNFLELWGKSSTVEYGPHLSIERNGGAAVFSGAGDGAITLPSNGVSAIEMLNEPGVACSLWAGSIEYISGSPHELMSRSITVPAAGYVLALATAWVQIFVPGTGASDCDFALSDQNVSMPDNYYALTLSGYNGTGTYNFPVTLQTVFSVAGAGTYTYYLLAEESLGDYRSFDKQLTLIYLPTAYGLVNAQAGSGAAAGPDAAAAEATNAARLEREMQELRAQVEALRAAVDVD